MIDYLCGQSLEILIPIIFILVYYTLIGGLRLLLRFFEIFDVNITVRKLTIIDLFAEILFYATSIMLIYEESWFPYFYFRTSIIILIDCTFALFKVRVESAHFDVRCA